MAAYLFIGAGILLLLAVAGGVFYLHRQRQQDEYVDEIEDLFFQISQAIEERGVRNQQLAEYKLYAAEEYIKEDRYRDAERVLHDMRNIILLS